jgi:hypothetical protein
VSDFGPGLTISSNEFTWRVNSISLIVFLADIPAKMRKLGFLPHAAYFFCNRYFEFEMGCASGTQAFRLGTSSKFPAI